MKQDQARTAKAVDKMSTEIKDLRALLGRLETLEKLTEVLEADLKRANTRVAACESEIKLLQLSMQECKKWTRDHQAQEDSKFAAVKQMTESLQEQLRNKDSHMGSDGMDMEAVHAHLAELQKAVTSMQSDASETRTFAAVARAAGSGPAIRARPQVDSQLLQTFNVTGVDVSEDMSSQQLAQHVERLIADKLKDRAGKSVVVNLTYARRLRPSAEHKTSRKVMIKVSTMWEAEALRECRTQLKGSGITILDELTHEEVAARQQLWGRFQEARKAGKKTYFNRARLYVENKEVKP